MRRENPVPLELRTRDRIFPLINREEALFEELAFRHGWRVTKRGWPDFLCFNDATGEIVAVEVKPRTKRGRMKALKPAQFECLTFLASKGIKCFVSDGKTLEPFSREDHGKRRVA